MEKEQAKELLPFIKAYAEGEQLQFKNSEGNWIDFYYNVNFDNLNSKEVRLKSSVIYRPFNTLNECWKEMKRHHPFGWIKCNTFINILNIFADGICVADDSSSRFYNYDKAFENFKFVDNTPFGIKN